MLSSHYGYRYLPGHLHNCDFEDGLTGWEVAPAEAVAAAQLAGYGRGSQARWGAPKAAGDTFAVLKRSPDQATTLTQTATGLTPGQTYTLQFVTADYRDMVARHAEPKKHPLTAILGEGADLFADESYVFVDQRMAGSKANDNNARINLHHLRFRATASSVTITFTDEQAAAGTETALNYVMLKPYYGE